MVNSGTFGDMNHEEIRIRRPDKQTLSAVISMAKTAKRTLGKQAEFMIQEYLRLTKGKK